MAIAEADNALCVMRDIFFMRDDDDGFAFGVEILEDGHDLLAGARIEVAGRLIAQDNYRIVDQRARDRYALLLAAGELARFMIHALAEADAFSAAMARAS